MKFASTLIAAAVTALALQAPAQAQAPAQKFPDRPIKLVVPFAAGGGVDSAARTLANQLATQLKVPVVVDNRAGANGTIGGKLVQTSPGDGYTLLFSAATHVITKQVMASAPYDPVTDFAPVARVGEAPLMMVVSPQLPAQNLTDVMATARKEPGKLTAAIPAAGAPSHLATLLLAKEAKVQFTFVPYKGTQPAVTDVAGGHTALLMDSMISLMPLAKAGRVRPVAITSARRSQLMPDVPTLQEAGMPGITYASWYGVWAPKDTPAERVKMLNEAINTAVAEQAKAGAWATLGIEPVKETVEQFSRFIAKDVAQSADLLKSAGFKPE
jgi:tripartite-type tricarboxylate transporter receptor subunit TctC